MRLERCHIKAVENSPSMPMMARMIVDSVIIAIVIKEFKIDVHNVHQVMIGCIIDCIPPEVNILFLNQ